MSKTEFQNTFLLVDVMRQVLFLILLISVLCTCGESLTQAGEGPVYSRHRGGARAGYYSPYDGYGYHGYYGFQPFVAGSWYARPYPYHFDYYRWRYNAQPPAPECPCAVAPVE